MRTTITCQGMKNEETTEEDLDVMAAQEEAEALASLAAAHRTLRDARESQHQVRMSTRLLPSATWATRSSPTEGRNGNASSAMVHTGPHSVQKSKGNPARRSEKTTAHTAYSEFFNGCAHRIEHVRKGSPGNRMGSDRRWYHQITGIVGGTGRTGTHESATPRFNSFSLDRTKKTWSNEQLQDQMFECNRSANAPGLNRVCHRWEPSLTSALVFGAF